jgi:hypothetical protein
MDILEIDAFMAELKSLQGPPPTWQDAGRPGELSATWNVADAIGVVRAQLRFRCPKHQRQWPSISLVYRQALIYRVDLVPPTECKPNPIGAHALGLPATVCGPHCHSWPDNRSYVHSAGPGHMPYRRPIHAQVRRLPQALLWLAVEINLNVEPDQRGFDVPPQGELFEA